MRFIRSNKNSRNKLPIQALLCHQLLSRCFGAQTELEETCVARGQLYRHPDILRCFKGCDCQSLFIKSRYFLYLRSLRCNFDQWRPFHIYHLRRWVADGEGSIRRHIRRNDLDWCPRVAPENKVYTEYEDNWQRKCTRKKVLKMRNSFKKSSIK